MKKSIDVFLLSFFVLPILPAYFLYAKNHTVFALMLISSFWFLGVICLVFPRLRNFLKKLIDKIFSALGRAVTFFMLSIGYIFVVIPTCILMKAVKRDRLRVSKQNCASYWIDSDNNTPDYERQF